MINKEEIYFDIEKKLKELYLDGNYNKSQIILNRNDLWSKLDDYVASTYGKYSPIDYKNILSIKNQIYKEFRNRLTYREN